MGRTVKINIGGKVYDATVAGDIDLDQEEVYLGDERLTEARAEELAREIMQRRGAKGGRPRLSDGPSAQMAFRLPAAMKDQLDEVAEHDGVKPAELARRAIGEYLERRQAS